jgi:hypothetical protein
MNFIVCWDLRSSGILYSVERPLLAHVSRQTIGRIFKGWEIQEGSCPWEIACPETSVSNYRSLLRNVAEERGSHLRRSFTPEIVQSLFFPLSVCRFIFSDIGTMQQLRRHQSCDRSPFLNGVSEDYLFSITKDGTLVNLQTVVSRRITEL